MRKYILIALGLLLAGPAFAADVVNGVDRSSAEYKAKYLKSSDPGTCDRNLFQRTGYQGGAKITVVPLWDSDRVQAQACIDAAGQGGARNNGYAAVNPSGGPSL